MISRHLTVIIGLPWGDRTFVVYRTDNFSVIWRSLQDMVGHGSDISSWSAVTNPLYVTVIGKTLLPVHNMKIVRQGASRKTILRSFVIYDWGFQPCPWTFFKVPHKFLLIHYHSETRDLANTKTSIQYRINTLLMWLYSYTLMDVFSHGWWLSGNFYNDQECLFSWLTTKGH